VAIVAPSTVSIGPRRRAAPTVIDLFAGCGGLSLGLELAGFVPIFVNELNRDAMESYLLNRRRQYPDLDTPAGKAYDIFDVTRQKADLRAFVSHLRLVRSIPDVDLVAGGPPCQGYSGIGHRRTFTDLTKHEIPSNHLYREMAKFIEAVRPKLFLFENVKGLLSSRWMPAGERGEIWADVKATFGSLTGYDIRAQVVQAKSWGVPQNRPRVLLVGVRTDLGWRPMPGRLADGLLPEPLSGQTPDPEDFLGDLVDDNYRAKAATTTYPVDATTEAQRWYRKDRAGQLLRGGSVVSEHVYSSHKPHIVAKFNYMINNGGRIRPSDQTKKFAQRVIPRRWGPAGPTITTTSLPDDYVHFSQPRIPTVREWARFQTFPDWYQFSGSRTTGGRRRAGDPSAGNWTREVPKYTQIGNAVPVWLARAVGENFQTLLR